MSSIGFAKHEMCYSDQLSIYSCRFDHNNGNWSQVMYYLLIGFTCISAVDSGYVPNDSPYTFYDAMT